MSAQAQDPPAAVLLPRRLAVRLAVDEFLAAECTLLDGWKLDDWLALFTEDATYQVPTTDQPNADPNVTLMLIDDDHLRLSWRVTRLKSRHAHREFPWSRTRRMLTNLHITEGEDGVLEVQGGLIVNRFRHNQRDSFIGLARYTLVPTGDSFLIRRRRVELDLERLSPNGALSVIV